MIWTPSNNIPEAFSTKIAFKYANIFGQIEISVQIQLFQYMAI